MEKYPHGTRVFKTRVSQFYFPSSSLRCSDPVFFFDIANLKSRSSNRPPSVQLFNRPDRSSSILCSSFFLYSSKLQIMPLQICSFFVLLQIVLPLLFFRSNLFQEQNRVLETRFCFLELESRSMWHHTSNSPSRNQVFNPRVLD